ncbi:DUF6183 family protein [Actinomadura hibisca]|uniref:DUF6183 family protein n=1 Tax=Actinomadura hibisca TaxID=68565 RepID=UPI00082C52E0|nr:DUF6183 family protein [Actinomadura hibisca]
MKKEQVRRYLETGHLAPVAAYLTDLLTDRHPSSMTARAFEDALLATARSPGRDRIALVLDIAERLRAIAPFPRPKPGIAAPEFWLRGGEAGIALWLANNQSLTDLLPVLGTRTELAACLLHELILRHGSLADHPEAVHLAEHLRLTNHPLANLPLQRLAQEEPAFPLLGFPTATHGLANEPVAHQTAHASLPIESIEVDWPEAAQAKAVLLDYQRTDPDLAEARLYLLAEPTTPSPALLLSLNAACLTGAETVQAREVSGTELWTTLFRKSMAGGPYTTWHSGAYSRARAWQSYNALCGPDPGSKTLLFATTSNWYLGVAPILDLGVAVLRPDSETLALLAATDSD